MFGMATDLVSVAIAGFAIAWIVWMLGAVFRIMLEIFNRGKSVENI